MKRAFVIIRVSAEDQLKGYGADVQWLDDILPIAPELGLEVDEQHRRIIQEPATTWERTKFEAVVREALDCYRGGEVQALLFPRVDRETRFVFGSFPLLAEVVQAGLEVYFAREQLHLDPKNSDSVERYLSKATQAQAYVETMRVNTMRGRRMRAKAGRLPGGKSVKLFGYDYIAGKGEGEGIRRVNEEEARWVKTIFRWFTEDGLSLRQIAIRLTELQIPTPSGISTWCYSTIHRMIKNTSYIGKTLAFNGTIEIPNQPIITQDVFEKTQQRLERNRELAIRNTKREYLLRGYVFCRQCGRRYVGGGRLKKTKAGIKSYRYYHCSRAYETLPIGPCCNRAWSAAKIEPAIWEEVKAVLRSPKTALVGIEAIKGKDDVPAYLREMEEIEIKLKDTDREKDNIWEGLRITGDKEKFTSEIRDIQARIVGLKRRKAELQQRIDAAKQDKPNWESINEACQVISSNLGELSFENKRLALEALKVKVWIDGDNISLEGFIPPVSSAIVSTQSQLTLRVIM